MATPQEVAQQAQALAGSGRADQAVTLLTRALARDARQPLLLAVLADAHTLLKDVARARYNARLAWEAAKADPGAAARAIDALLRCEDVGVVAALVEKAPAQDASIYERVMGAALVAGMPAIAERVGARALALLTQDQRSMARVSMPYASALLALGRPEDAYAFITHACATTPHPALLQHAAVLANYCEEDPVRVRQLHDEFARVVESAVARDRRALASHQPDPGRTLCIGLLSGDFRDHSVMWFLKGFLARRDRAESRLVCFSTQHAPDAATALVRAQCDAMHDITSMHPAAARDLIGRERVDVLVDLSGHSWGSSPHLLALRAAPVQVTMIGYPATTGLSTVDVRVVDSLTDPPGADAYAAERLARLDPCFLCYTPREDLPAPTQRPTDATMTFASFNAQMKHTEKTLALWARVLNALPGSRLCMKNKSLGDEGVRTTLSARLRRAGLDPARVEMLPWADDPQEHMRAYGGVDIALDTFPYHGTTTTCEALSMGVPVISRVGATHASRVGLSLLTSVGLSDFACTSDDAFVDAAVALARDPGRRTDLRGGLRARMLGGPLCDGVAHTRRLEELFRDEWRRVCAAR